VTRLLALLWWPLAVAYMCAAAARADVGGTVPAPGLCDYPSVCSSGAAFGEYDYAERWPDEINGSHRQCLLGGAMYSGTGGVSALFFNVSVTTPLGVIRGACWYACPDPWLSSAEMPNPPGAWKNYLQPATCKPIGPAPIPINPPPDHPVPAPLVPPAPPPPLGPAVTNPLAPNPDVTENPPH
jgi:hypothetical protein